MKQWGAPARQETHNPLISAHKISYTTGGARRRLCRSQTVTGIFFPKAIDREDLVGDVRFVAQEKRA